MKIVGIGAPQTLELRLRSCERGVWREVLRQAAAGGRTGASSSAQRWVARLQQQVDRTPQRDDQPFVVTGPTDVLATLIGRAAGTAVSQHAAATSACLNDPEKSRLDALRASGDTAHAWTATLIALRRVQGLGAARNGD